MKIGIGLMSCALLVVVGCEQRPRRLSMSKEEPTPSASNSASASSASTAASGVASAMPSSSGSALATAPSTSSTSTVPQLHYGVVTLAGTLGEQSFFGPPGYGADPAHDAKEPTLVLQLLAPVDVVRADGDDDWDEDRVGVKKVSIAGTKDPALDLHKEIGHPVKLKGKLFGAHSPHHHTDVLMSDVEVVPE